MDFKEKNTSSVQDTEIKNEQIAAQKEQTGLENLNEVKTELKDVGERKSTGSRKTDKTDDKGRRSSVSARVSRASIGDIKEKAKAIEVIVPKTEKEQALDKIKEVHDTLNAAERSVFEDKERDKINRNTFGGLSKNDKKKRAEMAIKRKKNAQAILEFEATHPEKEPEPIRIDKATLKKKIAAFKKMRSKPYDMGTDKKFIANLEKNYQLCEEAETMRRYIEAAVDGRYMIEGEDLHVLMTKIEVFAEVKWYLDAQKSLMKNPFYQYMAKDDISYTDSELEYFEKKTANQDLKAYLNNVKIIRSLHFVRHKGMDSAQKFAEDRGLRAAKLLMERDSKRKLVERFTDIALRFNGNKRFLDSDYDSRFTPELFRSELARFNAVRLSDLHFGSLQDIADHFEKNQRMFDQAHDMEHLLMVAIQRGMSPDDEELIKLRAKIETCTLAERMISRAQKTAIQYPDKLIKEREQDEFADTVFGDTRSYTQGLFRQDPPKFGTDLTAYMRKLTKSYQQDQKDCEKTIRTIYGLTHGTDDMEPVDIPDDELERRKRDFQRNVFRSEYMRNTDAYIQDVYGDRIHAAAHAYARRTGLQSNGSLMRYARTITPYLCGKSSNEIIRALDIIERGTDEQKDKFWTNVAMEAFRLDPTEMMTSDPEILFRNAAYKSRLAKIYENLSSTDSDGIPENVKDELLRKKAQAYYNSGCVFTGVLGVYAQANMCPEMGSLGIEDWVHSDFDKIYTLTDSIESGDTDQDKLEEFSVCGVTHNWTARKIGRFSNAIKKIYDLSVFTRHHIGPGRFSGEVWDPVELIVYDELKRKELVKALTPDDLKEITKAYAGLKAEYEAKEESKLIAKLEVIRDKKTDDAAKQKKASAMEDLFGKVMEFDIDRFDFASYQDMYIAREKDPDPNRALECLGIIRYAKEAVKLIDEYKSYRTEENIRCRLNGIHVDEIAARCDLIMRAGIFYDERFISLMSSEELSKTGMAFDDIIHMAPQEIDEKIEESKKSKDKKLEEFWSAARAVRAEINGYDIGHSLRIYENSSRRKRGLMQRSRAQEAAGILQGVESVFTDVKAGEISFTCMKKEDFKSQFNTVSKERSLTVSEREAKLDNEKSRLHVKCTNRNLLIDAAKQAAGRTAAARSGMSIENRVALGDGLMGSLSAFMTGDKKADNALVTRYLDKKKGHKAVLDEITRDLMKTNINIEAGSDAEFAEAAPELAQISIKARAYEKLLNADPEYQKRLMTKEPTSTVSDYDRVMAKLDKMLAISDYYRARRVLLTNPYYILHYNDEMVVDRKKAGSGEQIRCADLIDLVTKCTERLDGTDVRSREAAGMERMLSEAESGSAQEAFLRFRPDLTKADPSAVHKANKEIARYLEAAGAASISPGELDDLLYYPHPEAEKYKTKAVQNYLDSVTAFDRYKGNDEKRIDLLSQERAELYNQLNEMLHDDDLYRDADVRFSTPEYRDPVTGEVFTCSTALARVIPNICLEYAGNMSNEDILEMFEGFLLPKRKDVDLSQENVRLYVRERFLDSMRRLFNLEYEHMKRFQNTYGTLGDELPFGVFMESLGEGQDVFVRRNQYGQDMTELVDTTAERKCLVDGKPMTVAEVLVKYGKILKTKADNAALLSPNYYQVLAGGWNDRFKKLDAFNADPDDPPSETYDMSTIKNARYLKNTDSFGGPRVTRSEARRIWKKTLSYADDTQLTGGNKFLEYNRIRLGLFSSSEKKKLKSTRKQDVELITLYDDELKRRRNELIEETKEEVGEGLSDELIEKLIVFHPRMSGWEEDDGQSAKDFYETLRQYAGIGVPDKQKAEARRAASDKLYGQWTKLLVGSSFVTSPDEYMGADPDLVQQEEARMNPDEVMEGSRLFKGEIRHMMFESIKSLAGSAEYGFAFSDEAKATKIRRDNVRDQLLQEIQRGIMQSSFYLELGDVGSKERSYPEQMYLKLFHVMKQMDSDKFDLDRAVGDPDFKEVMEFAGVSVEGLKAFEVKIAEPVKKAPEPVKKEKKAAKTVKEEVKEEAKEEKISEVVKEEKKEEKVPEPVIEEQIREPIEKRRSDAQYRPKIISKFIIENIKDGSAFASGDDKTIVGFAKYIAGQTAQALGQHLVTWNDVKDELKYWLMDKEFKEVSVKTGENGSEVLEVNMLKIDRENVDQQLERIRVALIEAGKVIDEQALQNEREALSKQYDSEPEYARGSMKAMLRAMIDVNRVEDLDQTAGLPVSGDPQTAEVMNIVKSIYPDYFKRSLTTLRVGPDEKHIPRTQLKIPEEDMGLVRWVFHEMPDGDLNPEQIADFKNKWSKKLSLMLAEGHYPSKITIDKMEVLFSAWWGAANRHADQLMKDALLKNLAGVDLSKPVPDHRIENEETARNFRQWYGLSCWAASGSVVSEWYLRNVLKDKKTVIDQADFLTPANLKLNPYAENLLEFEKKYPHGNQGIHGEVESLQGCFKPHGITGSLITTADTILSRMKETGVRHVRFAMTAADPYMRGKMDRTNKLKLVKLLFERIGELIEETGGPISMLLPGHYRTVIGVDSNTIRFRDSLDPTGPSVRTYTLEQFLNTWEPIVRKEGMFQVELVGLQHLTGANKDELKEKFGYHYNDNGELRYSLKEEMIDAASTENIIHNLGRIYSNTKLKSDNMLDRYLKDTIYVPRNLDNVKNVKETERRNGEVRRILGLPDKSREQINAENNAIRSVEAQLARMRKDHV